jgi:hypothetical protein
VPAGGRWKPWDSRRADPKVQNVTERVLIGAGERPRTPVGIFAQELVDHVPATVRRRA